MGDLPDTELEFILQQRCALAPSYSKKLVGVMRELYRTRQVHLLPLMFSFGHALTFLFLFDLMIGLSYKRQPS